jgi:hypothetical protein
MRRGIPAKNIGGTEMDNKKLDNTKSERTMTIDEIRWHYVEYYNARYKEFPQEIQNYKILLAEIDRLKKILEELGM